MQIGFLATEGYYVDHLASIWLALPQKQRGPFFVTSRAYPSAVNRGVHKRSIRILDGNRKSIVNALSKEKGLPVLTASFANWRVVTRAGLPNPTIPHGPGGPGQGNGSCWLNYEQKPDLMLVAAEYGKGSLEGINTIPLNGQPKLDRWFGYKPSNKHPVLAISFRWKDEHCALDHYTPFLKEIKRDADKKGIKLLGHGHPLKFKTHFKKMWEDLGIEATPSLENVLKRADVYAADMSSSSFEFVALDRPVVFLHHPKYEQFDYAPRFTKSHAGITNWNPEHLIDDALRALSDPKEVQNNRREVALELYGDFKGESSASAAKILIDYYD